MKTLYTFFLFFIFAKIAIAQTSVSNIHLLVDENKSEYALQDQAKNSQAKVNAAELENKTLLNKLHVKYGEIQDRYTLLAIAIDAARIGIKAQPIIDNIIINQKIILKEASNDPSLLIVAFESEKKFVDEGQKLVRFLIGVVVSVGDVYSLKPSDRFVLFSHVVDELYKLDHISRKLASSMSYHNKQSILNSMNPFHGFISKDKKLVDDIMSNWELLKK